MPPRFRGISNTSLPHLGPVRDDGSSKLWNLLDFYFTQRTPFYDSQLLDGIDAGCRQVVLLGAGFDSRPFRLGLPMNAVVFEIDQAPVLEFKERVLLQHRLIPDCSRVPLRADLREDIAGPLLSRGFRPERQTVWIAEGLLMYFTRAQANQLLDRVTALSAAGSRIISEYFTHPWDNRQVNYELLDEKDREVWDLLTREFLNGPLPQEPGAWLSSHGWQVRSRTTVGELGRAARREVPPEFAMPDGADIWLFDGVKLSSVNGTAQVSDRDGYPRPRQLDDTIVETGPAPSGGVNSLRSGHACRTGGNTSPSWVHEEGGRPPPRHSVHDRALLNSRPNGVLQAAVDQRRR